MSLQKNTILKTVHCKQEDETKIREVLYCKTGANLSVILRNACMHLHLHIGNEHEP